MYAQTPRANLLWALFCLAAAFLYFCYFVIESSLVSSNVAPLLAEQLHVPVRDMDRNLAEIWGKYSLRKALVFGAPWLLMGTLYASRAWMQFLESDEDEEVFSPLPEGHVTSE